jgi:hypothetical protein
MNYAVNCGLMDVAPSSSLTAPYPAYDGQANGVFFNQWQPTSWTTTQAITTQTLSYIAKWDGASNTLLMSENMDAEEWIGEFAPNNTATGPTGSLTATEYEIGLCWFWDATDQIGLTGTGAAAMPIIGLNQSGGFATSSTTRQYYARPSGKHPGGFVVAMCDGQAKFLSQDIQYSVYARLMSPRGAMATVAGGLPTATITSNTPTWPTTTWTAPISETDLNP